MAARLSRPRPPKGRGAAAARALDHAAARAGRRHRGGAPRARRGPRAPVDARVAHRRHRAPASARASASASRPRWSPRPRACRCCSRATTRRAVRHLRAGGRRRVARADGDEARRADRARAGAAARAGGPGSAPGASRPRSGNLDDARDALLGVTRPARHGPAASCGASCPRRLQVDALIPATIERFPWAGHLGMQMLPQVVARDRGGRERARVHQHARHRRDLVPGAPRGAARLGRDHRAAPRLARPEDPRLGRGRAARRAGSAAWSARRRSTSASTSRRSTACCRSAAPRASRGCSSAPAAAATGPAP